MQDHAFTLIEPSIGQWRSAKIDAEGFPSHLSFHPHSSLDATGAIYRARISKIDKALDMAFLDIGDGKQAMMSQRRARLLKKGRSLSIADSVTEGQILTVQAVNDPKGHDGKSISVTPRPKLTGRYVVVEAGGARLNFSKDIGPARTKRLKAEMETLATQAAIIVRTRANYVDDQFIVAEAKRLVSAISHDQDSLGCIFHSSPAEQALLGLDDSQDPVYIAGGSHMADTVALARSQYPDLVERLTLYTGDMPAFDACGVEDAIDEALMTRIELPSGGTISITPTPAITAIDVNMGSAFKAQDAAEAKFHVNMEAAMAIAHHLRFQNIGGLIVVDFIDMTGKGRIQKLTYLLSDLFKDDDVPVQCSGISNFGLMEIKRARKGQSLKERLQYQPAWQDKPFASALKALQQAETVGMSADAGALVIQANKQIVDCLNRYTDLMQQLEAATSRLVIIEESPNGHTSISIKDR